MPRNQRQSSTSPRVTRSTATIDTPPNGKSQRVAKSTSARGGKRSASKNPTATPTRFRTGIDSMHVRTAASSASVATLTPNNANNISGASSTLDLTPLLRHALQSPSFINSTPVSATTDSPLSTMTNTRVERMRLWRHDALQQHLYDTAATWGEQIVALTGDPNDIFWLAQVYYLTSQYTRAESLLFHKNLLESSIACRVLAAQCCISMEKWNEALQVLGTENPFRKIGVGHVKNTHGGIKLEATMCFLRGKVFVKQSNFGKAKEAFQEALRLDFKCIEALDALEALCLMNGDDEWSFIQSIDFDEQDPEDADFIKSIYISKLKKYTHMPEINDALEKLQSRYGLHDNCDVLLSQADIYVTQSRFADALVLTNRICEIDTYNIACLPIHIVCLYELNQKQKLFMLAHELVESYAQLPISCKSSTIDSNFGPAWVGFAHTFAIDGEHDQAIAAYSTSARLFQGTHLPSLFLGMQHLQMDSVALADEYLHASYKLCENDPLVLNEMGVLLYQKREYTNAVSFLERAIYLAQDIGCEKKEIWETIWFNLGHAFRKLGKWSLARTYFEKVIAMNPSHFGAYAALGMVLHLDGHIEEAIEAYHQALAISPTDMIASDLLLRALEDMCHTQDDEPEDEDEDVGDVSFERE
ncbi:hypothetical protein BZG36_02307 [Bifiguratus adelaidae]|uniref:Anaphase-promoting complex subunit cut9 n=1 Tax=Bifiguratus adelaidae TaxID=1938954 RepID=A0A261Y3P5_9FUNG|nr:hypothetical protein BZG36_02307 [Bifiguratus adelaidae]